MSAMGKLNVSRETLERLEAFSGLVQKWTAKINLISKASVAEVWERHIVDSAQIYRLAEGGGHWVDLGSGGGFPGVVCAILSKGEGDPYRFTLVESDQRKCAFLRTAIRELGLDAEVICDRIEAVDPLQADVLSARALADLSILLSFSELHLKKTGVALFPKGETWPKEHKAAQIEWSYAAEMIRSETNDAAAVLKIKEIVRV
jgi:16S rRNA (guanine527-N7)-methyltransferase